MEPKTADLNLTLSYLQTEINRVGTIAGTLSTVESQHYKDLTNIGGETITQIAIEEQSGARQLGEIQQICLTLAQKVRELQQQVKTTDESR